MRVRFPYSLQAGSAGARLREELSDLIEDDGDFPGRRRRQIEGRADLSQGHFAD